MEEQKNKEIKMETPQIPEGEDLQKVCDDLYTHNQQLEAYIKKMQQQMREMSGMLQYRRMDYLMDVVRISSQYKNDSDYPCFAAEFIENCIAEIQETLTIPSQEEPSKGN